MFTYEAEEFETNYPQAYAALVNATRGAIDFLLIADSEHVSYEREAFDVVTVFDGEVEVIEVRRDRRSRWTAAPWDGYESGVLPGLRIEDVPEAVLRVFLNKAASLPECEVLYVAKADQGSFGTCAYDFAVVSQTEDAVPTAVVIRVTAYEGNALSRGYWKAEVL